MTERKINPKELLSYLEEGIEHWETAAQNKEREISDIEARISTLRFVKDHFFPEKQKDLP